MAKKRRKKTYIKKTNKIKMGAKRSRTIPEKISNIVKEQHFFQCAWCCTKLTDQHHIQEFSGGGEHTSENLILLCPNDHRDLHQNGSISKDELYKRKSTHKENDRIDGGFRTTSKSSNLILGDNLFVDAHNILTNDGENIISLIRDKNSILVNLRFYDKEGDLKFWMSRNRYWMLSEYIVTNTIDLLEVRDKGGVNFFKMWQQNGVISVEGECYLKGNLFKFNSKGLDPEGLVILNNVLHRGIRKGYDSATGEYYTLIG
jgi:hypothetical protein